MNILRKIRRQRIVDRAYTNGYEQGRYDTLLTMPGRAAGHDDRGCEVCAIWDASTEARAAGEGRA